MDPEFWEISWEIEHQTEVYTGVSVLHEIYLELYCSKDVLCKTLCPFLIVLLRDVMAVAKLVTALL